MCIVQNNYCVPIPPTLSKFLSVIHTYINSQNQLNVASLSIHFVGKPWGHIKDNRFQSLDAQQQLNKL